MVLFSPMKIFSRQSRSNRNYPYYYKILFSILLLSLIPSTIMTLYYSQSSLSLIREKAKETNLLYLRLMSNSLEIVIENILDFSNLLAIDNVFSDYVRIADKKYFEQFSEVSQYYSEQDFKRFYEYLNIRGEIYDTLETMTLSNEFIDSIYFLDSSRDMVFRNGRLPEPFKSFPDKAWKRVLDNNELLPHIMSIRRVEGEDKNSKNIISIISENIEEEIPFIINLDAEVLYRAIISSVDWDPDNIFFILSKSGEPLLYSSKDRHVISKISILSENKYLTDSDFLTIGNRQYMINSLKIEPLGWTVYSASDVDKFKKAVHPLRVKVFALAMLFFPLSLLLAYYLGQKLYRPIRKLSGYVQAYYTDPETEETTDHGDLSIIWRSLKTSRQREMKLEEKFRESLPSYRNDFLKRLLLDHNYHIDEILERLKYISSPLKAENLAIIIIRPDDSHNSSLSISEKMVFGLKIEQIVSEDFFTAFPGEFLSMSSSEYCVIFNSPQTGLNSVVSEIDALMDSLKNRLSMEFTFGIGSPARSIFDLNMTYTEALDAIRLRSIADTGHAIFYEDMKIGDIQSNVYDPTNKTSLLKDSIKMGNIDESVRVINEIDSDLRLLKDSLSFRKAKQIYITILNELLYTLNDLGLESESVLNSTSPFEELFALSTIKDINTWMIELVTDLATQIGNLSREKKNRKIEAVLSVVENECGQDINLNIIADRINLNPSYVSRLFKEHMNKSFIDYLTDVRMDKAMVLLKETDLKISEIGTEVGYFNSNYFIRIFKKKTGRTPGEYRQLFQ